MSTTRFHDTSKNFHLRNCLMFNREGDEIIIEATGTGTTHRMRVPLAEWASAVAWTTTRGETGETYQETLALLGSYESDV